MNDKGITELVCECLSVHHPETEGDLADTAVELITEMLIGGNKRVQNAVCQFINTKDVKGGLIAHISKRIKNAERDINLRKEQTKVKYVPMTREHHLKVEDMIETCRLLQLLCEGHALDLQETLRHQPNSQGSVNLIQDAIDLLIMEVESAGVLRRMDHFELEGATSILDFLIEALQGPCSSNQLLVAESQAVEAIKQILPSPFNVRVSTAARIRFKGCATRLLAAMLEGREDLDCHRRLADSIEPGQSVIE